MLDVESDAKRWHYMIVLAVIVLHVIVNGVLVTYIQWNYDKLENHL